MLLALLAACGRQAPDPAPPSGGQTIGRQTTAPDGGGVSVEFRSDPDPPRSGRNTFDVTVKQPDGTPVTDATVTAVFSMPAMPSMNMPAMRADVSLTHMGQGTYRGTGQLSMGGTWSVVVSVARGSEPLATARFSIVANQPRGSGPLIPPISPGRAPWLVSRCLSARSARLARYAVGATSTKFAFGAA